MSYILDALKKSDEERMASLAEAPVQLAPTRHAGRSRLGWFVLPAVLALLAGGWLLILFQHDPDAVKVRPEQGSKAVAPSSIPMPVMPVAQPPREGLPVKTAPKAVGRMPAPVAPVSQPSALQTSAAMPHPKTVKPAPRVIPAAQEKEEPPRRADLPVHIQQALPPIRIEGHIYDADPSARMVIINGHVRREGQQLEGGLRLESITERGIVLSRQGTRFRMGVFEH
ncbi:MAG: general secretion pathway protein GspB [Mariprofundaceae bacterium]